MASVNVKSFLGVNEMRNWEVLCRQLFAEFLGTFLYLSLCLVVSDEVPSTVTAAFANGLIVASVVQLIGHVSGGHINPAVTTGMMICGYIKPLRAICYVAVQAMGAIAGAAVAYIASISKYKESLGSTVPREDLRLDQTFLLELIATFTIVSVTLSVTDPNRGSKGLGSAALAVGLSITACLCACLSYTGSFNPVRSLGPAVVMNIWTNHWIYWLAPMLGGVVAGVVYSFALDMSIA